jgi:diguanylate cyclase (GGDEF)-like protein/PAS domain S-box-containing protein
MCLLGTTVAVREHNSRVSVFFFVMSLAVSSWLFCYALMYAAPDARAAERWARTGYFGAPFIPATAYVFSMELLGRAGRRSWLSALLWGLGTVFAVGIIGGGWLIDRMILYPWGYYPDYHLTSGLVFIGAIAAGVGATVWEWWQAYRSAESGTRRTQARWFLGAFILSPLTLLDFLPSFHIDSYPFGYLVVVGVTAIMAAAILRYRLVELTPRFAAEKILDTMADPLLVCDVDGGIEVANDAVEEIFDYAPDELVGRPVTDLVAPDEQGAIWAEEAGRTIRDREMTFVAADGREVIASVSRNPVEGPEGQVVGAVVIARDIDRRKRAEAALQESRRRYQLAAEGAHDGLWDWDLQEGSVFYSERWKQMLGLQEEEVGDEPSEWLDRVHPEDRPEVDEVLEGSDDGEASHFKVEYRIEDGRGEWRWMLCRGVLVRGEDGSVVRMAGSQTDITERKRVEAQLRHDAFHDSLTEIPNRALFIDRVEELLAQREEGFSVLFMDLDRFKAINDSLGHTIGDALLRKVSRRVDGCLSEPDTIARLGGDEFGIILAEVAAESTARGTANRIRERMEEPFQVDDHRLYVSASIGVLVSKGQHDSAKDLLRDVDLAMYNAKRDRVRQVAVYDGQMGGGVVEEAHLESALRRAIEGDELELNYQPIVDLETEQPVGFEALCRWEHPEFGPISPAEFVPLAEETGLVVPLGRWVLSRACDQMTRWLDEGLVDPEAPMNVNLSAPEISSPDLLSTIDRGLRESGLPGHNLQVEITERILITNPDELERMFTELDAMDVRVAIDDFGTGYSSLSYLRRFRADAMKIDREFVQGVHRSDADREIVRAVLELADNLGLKVVAEGIEAREQLDELRELGIGLGQGFVWCEPMTAEKMTDRLRNIDDESREVARPA